MLTNYCHDTSQYNLENGDNDLDLVLLELDLGSGFYYIIKFDRLYSTMVNSGDTSWRINITHIMLS